MNPIEPNIKLLSIRYIPTPSSPLCITLNTNMHPTNAHAGRKTIIAPIPQNSDTLPIFC